MGDLRAKLPDEMIGELDARVRAGEFRDLDQLIEAALRYYIERHRREAWQEYVRDEVAWSARRAGG